MLQFIRSKTLLSSSTLSESNWKNLGLFAVQSNASHIWEKINDLDKNVKTTVQQFQKSNITDYDDTNFLKAIKYDNKINWSFWNDQITHKDILSNLKQYYDEQISLLNQLENQDHTKIVSDQCTGWNLYDDCMKSCQEKVQSVNNMLSSGVQNLWISYNNPMIQDIDPNEWIESDQYWAAYVEKHNLYNPNQGCEDPETDTQIQERKSLWHLNVGKFNDRSDTPILFQYMNQLPSFEYYDIHRRAFFEHMVYYLIRTGGHQNFFPETPPIEWLTHIELLRYQFLSVTQRRRAHFQLENLERERPLDLQPIDYEHDGEEFFLKFIQQESKRTDLTISRLMGNYMFLCHPYIPIQSKKSLIYSIGIDNMNGQFFSFGDDVNCLFYLPDENHRSIMSPKLSFTTFYDYLILSGIRLNPAYATFLEIFCEILSQRGDNWYKAPDESFSEAFLRRLDEDDPLVEVFNEYIVELNERISNRILLSNHEDVLKRLAVIETNYMSESIVYKQLLYSEPTLELAAQSIEEKQNILNLNASGQLPELFNSGELVLLNESRDVNVNEEISSVDSQSNCDALLRSFDHFSAAVETTLHSINSIQLNRGIKTKA